MTEAEWLACDDPFRMASALRWMTVSERRMRLCACACCRVMWHNLVVPESKAGVEDAERLADGKEWEDETAATNRDASAVPSHCRELSKGRLARLSSAESVERAGFLAAESALRFEDGWHFSFTSKT